MGSIAFGQAEGNLFPLFVASPRGMFPVLDQLLQFGVILGGMTPQDLLLVEGRCRGHEFHRFAAKIGRISALRFGPLVENAHFLRRVRRFCIALSFCQLRLADGKLYSSCSQTANIGLVLIEPQRQSRKADLVFARPAQQVGPAMSPRQLSGRMRNHG